MKGSHSLVFFFLEKTVPYRLLGNTSVLPPPTSNFMATHNIVYKEGIQMEQPTWNLQDVNT